ncbi:MAG: extracellular solute-binding protein, partial [Leptospira sp.]|nr:extracellular solute-binding protein [Leptospira sp.]
DPHTIEFTAKTIHWNNFNEVASGFYILPKHAFEGKDFNKMNFEFPVTSGPYKLFDSKKGRFVKMQRRGDYWQRAYPFNKGRYNFDMLLFKFFNDGSIAFQALKKGDVDIYGVNIAFIWIKEATGEKFDRNLIAKQKVFNDRPIGFQGWAMNTRKDIFKDRRVRKAISHLVNRKLMIEKLAYGQYEPTNSYYPDYYFGKEKNPNEPVDFNVGKARALLAEAGWKANSKGILEKEGKEFSFKILDRDGSTEKYFTVFLEVAKQVGIKAGIDRTDLAGWSARVDKYDFDMTWAAWGGAMFKDPEAQWSSKFADEEGQPNLSGLKIPEVDRLIEAQKGEFDVAKRNQIVKKIDTIVYKEYPYVLLWHLNCSRLLYWQKFGMPSYPLGKYGDETAALDYWWIDEKKTTELENADKNNGSLSAIEKEIRWKE